jgi:hypothetical protein
MIDDEQQMAEDMARVAEQRAKEPLMDWMFRDVGSLSGGDEIKIDDCWSGDIDTITDTTITVWVTDDAYFQGMNVEVGYWRVFPIEDIHVCERWEDVTRFAR